MQKRKSVAELVLVERLGTKKVEVERSTVTRWRAIAVPP
jgi:hypothetical protein